MSQVIPEDLPKKNGVTILNYDLVADLNRIADDVDDEDTAMDLNFAAEAARTYVERLGAAEQRIDEDNVERNRIRAERDRLKEQLAEAAEQIKHHEDNERFSREIDLEPSQMTDDQLCADTEYSASCSCGLCRFVRHLLELRAKVAEQDALLKVLASAEAANRYADQMLTSADLDIAALQAKVAELEGSNSEHEELFNSLLAIPCPKCGCTEKFAAGKLAYFECERCYHRDRADVWIKAWVAQVRREALEEAAQRFDGQSFGPYRHPSQIIRALIEGGA